MELCTSRAISNLPHGRFFSLNPSSIRSTAYLPLKKTTNPHRNPGLLYFATPLLRAKTSEETSTSTNEQSREAPDGVISLEENSVNEQCVPFEVMHTEEAPKEEAPMGEKLQAFEFLDKLDIQLDSEYTYSILLYGSGALVVLWLASAIVGAIDSIPLIPKVLEIVGLGFTIWFSSRNLIFKKSRDELLAKIEELKQEVLGSTDE